MGESDWLISLEENKIANGIKKNGEGSLWFCVV